MARFTEVQAQEIRDRYHAGGISQDALAYEYGVAQSVISGIILRKVWKHI